MEKEMLGMIKKIKMKINDGQQTNKKKEFNQRIKQKIQRTILNKKKLKRKERLLSNLMNKFKPK